MPPLHFNSGGFRYNLANVPRLQQVVSIELESTREIVTVVADLGSVSGCPAEADCVGPVEASVWKCWNSSLGYRRCFAVADPRYGVSLTAETVIYEGGFAGYATEFRLLCAEGSAFVIGETGGENGGRVVLQLHGKEFCKIRGSIGAGILVGLLAASACYIFGGVIGKFALNGVIDIPNHALWQEVWLLIEIAISWLAGCCCRTAAEAASEAGI
jgi:hypothetical protein